MGYLSPTTRQGVSSRIKRFIISFYGEVGKQRIFARPAICIIVSRKLQKIIVLLPLVMDS